MSNNTKYIAVVAMIIAIISLGIIIFGQPPVKSKPSEDGMASVSDLELGGDFILHDPDGKVFDSSTARGKYLLIYFGFTYCPDICPASLLEMTQVINALGDQADKLQPIFITIDPKRDTNAQLKSYFASFDSRIMPLSGSEQEIRAVADKFKVYYARSTETGSDRDDNYMLNHSSFFYLINPKGKLIRYYDTKAAATTMAIDVKEFVERD